VPENPYGLIPASEAQAAVEVLRRRGLGILDIARVAGISQEAARRAVSGHGQLRRSTRDALLAAVASVNGKPGRAI
jgi:predicted nucleic acid-binding protein